MVLLFSLVLIPRSTFATDGWNLQIGSGSRTWTGITSSSDGTKLAATEYNGYIYTSTDSGVTWTQQTDSGQRLWGSIASSSDGTKLAAVAGSDYIYTSTDSGVTWTQQTDSGSRGWQSITSSSDGTKLAAVASSNNIYTSTNSGVTWTEQTDSGSRNWSGITSSSDGTKLAAVVLFGYIYTSTDSGVTWTEQTSSGFRGWKGVTSSSDGTKLAATPISGNIYTSTDSGVTWTAQTSSGTQSWVSVASSSDGAILLAGTASFPVNYLYISTNSGATWTAQTNTGVGTWSRVTSSSDGTKLAAVSQDSYIFTYGSVTPGTVSTSAATTIKRNIVTFNGETTSVGSGAMITRGFEYGLTTSYGSTKSNTGGFGTGTFSTPVGLLQCNTLYHYRAFGQDGTGLIYGSDTTVTTGACTEDSVILYGVDGSGSNPSPAKLYTLDIDTGLKAQLIGAVGYGLTGLAIHPITSVMYGSTGGSGSNSKSLVTVNRTTGAGTLLGQIRDTGNTARVMSDLAFDANGLLYGFSPNTSSLYTIDPTSCNGTTCQAVEVADCDECGGVGGALTFGSDGTLYLFDDDDASFLVLDPVTGQAIGSRILISNPSGRGALTAADLSGDGLIYASRMNFGSNPADLITFDPDTATITSLLASNSDMRYMDAIAFYITPPVLGCTNSAATNYDPSATQDNGSCVLPVASSSRGGIPISVLQAISDRLRQAEQVNPLPTNPSPVITFVKYIKFKERSEDVKNLQKYLNDHGYIVSKIGAGSKGKETTYFGLATKEALKKFQRNNNLVPDGIFGNKTREAVNKNL